MPISNRVFVSHSRKAKKTKRAVKRGLAAVGLKPWFVEEEMIGQSAVAEIKNKIKTSIGFFVFFTQGSIKGVTRDWICFELGLARALGHDIYSWKREDISRKDVPVFIPQISNSREYTTDTLEDIENLERQVRKAGNQLLHG